MLQLIPVPPPPPDFCLLWAHRWWVWSEPWWACMQKGEWASWAQAVFSVLAIFVAIWLPRRDAKSRKTQTDRRAYGHALSLTVWLRNLIKGCDDHDLDAVRVAALAVEEVLESGRGIPLELLDPEGVTRVVACQGLARRIAHIAEQLERFKPAQYDHFQWAKTEFLDCQKHVMRHGVNLSDGRDANFFERKES